MTKKESKEWDSIIANAEQRKRNGFIDVEPVRTELDVPADLVVIGRVSRQVESKCVWQDIRNIGRLKRLQAREQAEMGAECDVVAVEARTTSLGEVLQDNQVIKL